MGNANVVVLSKGEVSMAAMGNPAYATPNYQIRSTDHGAQVELLGPLVAALRVGVVMRLPLLLLLATVVLLMLARSQLSRAAQVCRGASRPSSAR